VYYQLYEMNHAAMTPMRAAADATRLYFKNPLNPLTHTPFGRSVTAACEVFERTTRRYGKPDVRPSDQHVVARRAGRRSRIERTVWERPFCKLVHFERRATARSVEARQPEAPDRRADVRPLRDAPARHRRGLPADATKCLHHRLGRRAHSCRSPTGGFDLDDYIDYVVAMMSPPRPRRTHVMAVCQPSVPVIAAAALHGGGERPARAVARWS
jgi:poly(3-hydroxybutyrate) depolymerase